MIVKDPDTPGYRDPSRCGAGGPEAGWGGGGVTRACTKIAACPGRSRHGGPRPSRPVPGRCAVMRGSAGTGRRDFNLAQIAELAGVSVATAYRNFADPAAAITAYADRFNSDLLAAFDAVPTAAEPLDELVAVCHAWVALAASWGPALVHLRSPEGILARRATGDPFIVASCRRLEAVLRRCVSGGALPAQDLEFAVLLWITLFDERVIVDLTGTRGRSVAATARQVTGALLAALRNPAGP